MVKSHSPDEKNNIKKQLEGSLLVARLSGVPNNCFLVVKLKNGRLLEDCEAVILCNNK